MTPIKKPKVKRPLGHEQAAIVHVMGGRMRQARELCGMSQIAAARRLGLSGSKKLSQIESATDIRTIPEWLKLRAAKLYQVSLDYLYGACDDWETSARMTQEREVGAYLFETFELMRRRDMDVLLRLHDQNEELRATLMLSHEHCAQLISGIGRYSEIHPDFEHTKGSAMIVGPADRAMESAAHGVRLIKRFRLRCQQAARDTHQLSLQLP